MEKQNYLQALNKLLTNTGTHNASMEAVEADLRAGKEVYFIANPWCMCGDGVVQYGQVGITCVKAGEGEEITWSTWVPRHEKQNYAMQVTYEYLDEMLEDIWVCVAE